MGTSTSNYSLYKPDLSDPVDVTTDLNENWDRVDAHAHSGTYVPSFVVDSAYGNGVLDATTAIQSKLDLASAAGGGRVHLPKGTYLVTASLTIASKVTLGGAGDSSVIKLGPGVNTVIGTNIHVIKNADTVGGNTGIVIESLKVDGNGPNNPGGHYCCIFLQNVTDCVIDRVTAIDPLRENNVEDTYGECIQIRDSEYCRVTNCLLDMSGVLKSKDGIKISGTSHTVVADNTCRNCNAAGVQLAYGTAKIPSTYNTVTGNNIYSDGTTPAYDKRSGIRIHLGLHNTVDGNTAYNVQVGLDLLEGADYNTLTDNLCTIKGGAGSAGILIRFHAADPCIGNIFRGNTIRPISDTSGAIIDLNGAEETLIEGNTFHRGNWSTRTVLLDANSTGNFIEGNDTRGAVSTTTVTDSGTTNRINLLGARDQFRGAKLKRTTNQTITTGVVTAVAFTAEDYDSDAFHDNATNNTRFTVPTGFGGKYTLAAGIVFASNAVGRRGLLLRLNGTTIARTSMVPTNNEAALHVGTTIQLIATDYVEAFVFQDSGGDLALDVTTYGTPAAWLTGERVGP